MTGSGWRLRYTARAQRDLRNLDPPIRRRVIAALENLTADPEASSGLRRLRGRPQSRLRVGDWRLLLELDRDQRAIEILRVLPRGRAYER